MLGRLDDFVYIVCSVCAWCLTSPQEVVVAVITIICRDEGNVYNV